MSKATKWGLLFLILLFPSLLYIGLSTGKHNLFSLPFYGDFELSSEGDTIFKAISIDAYLLEHGPELDTCNYVLAFMNPKNQELSSRVGTQLSAIAEKLDPMPDFRLVIFSNESLSKDSLAISAFNSSNEKWKLINLNGTLRKLANEHFSWDALDGEKLFYRVYLVDKQSYVRGVYNGDEYAKVKELSDDIKALKADELIPKKTKKNGAESSK